MAKTTTTILDPTELRYLLIDSLKQYSESAIFISGSNPYKFKFNKEQLYIFIHNVHSTGEGRGNKDECRIQINSSSEFEQAKKSRLRVMFLGYFADLDVYTAWDPSSLTGRINIKSVVSVYSRFSVLKKAEKRGMALYLTSNGQTVISFRPEFLGLYLENTNLMHRSSESELLELINKSSVVPVTGEQEATSVMVKKKKYLVSHQRFIRDPRFRKMIGDIYSYRCAMCGIQLDLVEAAHIIPYPHNMSTNEPQNGLCLCALHHLAFDKGLVFLDADYKIILNDLKIKYLKKVGKDAGLDKFKNLQESIILLPTSAKKCPSKACIKLGNKIRGILEKSA